MRKTILTLSLMTFMSFLGYSEPIGVGATVPDIQSVDQDGHEVKLQNLLSKGITLVYFYPKADTPGCTAQACNLRDAFETLTQKGIQVIGVSADKPAAQKAFKEKYQLPFILLADSELKVIQAFGVPVVLGKFVSARQSFLVKENKVVWRDLKATPKQQAEDVLQALQTLK